MAGNWVFPTPALPGADGGGEATAPAEEPLPPTLTQRQVEDWQQKGFVHVTGVWPAELVRQIITEVTDWEAAHPGGISSHLSHASADADVISGGSGRRGDGDDHQQLLTASSSFTDGAKRGVEEGEAGVLSPFDFANPAR